MPATLTFRVLGYGNAWAHHRLRTACARLPQHAFEALTDTALYAHVHVHRTDRVQHVRCDRLLLHLLQHRGQGRRGEVSSGYLTRCGALPSLQEEPCAL